jgi:hypothetical protein
VPQEFFKLFLPNSLLCSFHTSNEISLSFFILFNVFQILPVAKESSNKRMTTNEEKKRKRQAEQSEQKI